MTIHVTDEHISIAQAAAIADVSRQTVWRWCKRGVRGARLETILVGGRRRTTREALDDFCRDVQARADGEPIEPDQRTRRRREIEAAEAALSDL